MELSLVFCRMIRPVFGADRGENVPGSAGCLSTKRRRCSRYNNYLFRGPQCWSRKRKDEAKEPVAILRGECGRSRRIGRVSLGRGFLDELPQ